MTTKDPSVAAPQGAATVARAATRAVARLPMDLLFLAVGVLTGGWALVLIVAVVSVVLSGGLPLVVIVLALVASVRLLMPVETWRLRWLGRAKVATPPPPVAGGRARFVRLLIGDLHRRQIGYLLVLTPVGVGSGLACSTLWAACLHGLRHGQWTQVFARLPVDVAEASTASWGNRLFSAVVLLPAAVALTRLLAHAQVRLAESRFGGPGRRRLDEVLISRARAVDAQTAELRRIERDLHDGAQARLVALNMQLALVGRALRPLGDQAIPARDQLTDAMVTSNAALADLRNLVRGIYPPILSDRGLEAALTALAADCAIPVDLELGQGERLAPAIEAAAYFTTAEALANAAKHAAATRCQIEVGRNDGVLSVSVTDDGRGGADPGGAGLTGLRHRVEALDGRLSVTSPVGGPTVVRADLPCG